MTNKEFEDYLVSIGGLENGYFTDRPPITTNMCECGEGWNQLIANLIQELIDAGWNKEILQIKEKFGGLRFYANFNTKEQSDLVRKYEEIAYHTCESCGSVEEVDTRSDGWITTLCKKCFDIRTKKRNER